MDVTIIIPTYNREWSLPRAIESCKGSNEVSRQIIVVDDGSTDGTWELLSETEGIEAYRQQNWGKPWAVNLAFSHARGKYIKFLDSDDWLVPGAIEKQYQLAEAQQAGLVVAGYKLYEDDKVLRIQEWIACDDFIAQNLGECDSSHYSAFLFRRDLIKDIPHRTSFAAANFAARDDRCLMLEVALREPRIAIFDEPSLCHTHHQKGRLQFQSGLAAACTNYQHLLIYKNILRQLDESGRLTKRRVKAAINVLWPLCHWIAKDDINEAANVYRWILELDPEFQIPRGGVVNGMYRRLGFKQTEKILALRRLVKHG